VTDPTPGRPSPVKTVEYRGEPLDAERGPGLGCFRFQLVALAVLVVLTPLTVAFGAPAWLSAILLLAVIVLLLVAGQTIIFLLRLIAADRRAAGRRRPLASRTPTVGELEDAATSETADAAAEPVDDDAAPLRRDADRDPPAPDGARPMQQ